MPLPDWANWLRPEWEVLVLCYWIFNYPSFINIGTAWILGLLLDALYGTILGEHALAMTIVAYVLLRYQRLLRHYPVWIQSFFIMTCSFLYNFIMYIIQWTLGEGVNDWRYWISPLLSFILWPLLTEGIKRVQIKFRII